MTVNGSTANRVRQLPITARSREETKAGLFFGGEKQAVNATGKMKKAGLWILCRTGAGAPKLREERESAKQGKGGQPLQMKNSQQAQKPEPLCPAKAGESFLANIPGLKQKIKELPFQPMAKAAVRLSLPDSSAGLVKHGGIGNSGRAMCLTGKAAHTLFQMPRPFFQTGSAREKVHQENPSPGAGSLLAQDFVARTHFQTESARDAFQQIETPVKISQRATSPEPVAGKDPGSGQFSPWKSDPESG
jgi:hypothetical protein